MLVGGALICLLGVLDDLFELDALTKLGGQVLAAGFLVLNRRAATTTCQLPGRGQFSLDPTQAALLHASSWWSATVNAVNFVDGLDGLAAGRGRRSARWRSSPSPTRSRTPTTRRCAITAALLCAALGGACVGFLPHNFFPARIFMGDSGSMLIGLVLAGSALTPDRPVRRDRHDPGRRATQASLLPTLLPILLPIAILLVPFVDLVLAVVRRTRAGRSPFAPDKKHLHHRLLEIGHSHRRAVADHVAVGGADRVRGSAGQPLRRPRHDRAARGLGGAHRGADVRAAAGAAPELARRRAGPRDGGSGCVRVGVNVGDFWSARTLC